MRIPANSLFHFFKECVMMHLSNAMKRNSISEPDTRKLLGDAKQQTEQRELALELLLEIPRESRCRRRPTVTGEEHTISGLTGRTEEQVRENGTSGIRAYRVHEIDHELEWYRVRHSLSSLIASGQ